MAVLVAMNKRLQEYFLSEKDGGKACRVFNDEEFVNKNDAAQIPNWCGHMPVMASKGAKSGFDPKTGEPFGRSKWQDGKAKNLGCAWKYSNGIGPNLQASNDQEKYAGQCVPISIAGAIVDGIGNAGDYEINDDTDIGADPTDAQKQVIDFAARHLQQMLKLQKDGLRNDAAVERARKYVKYAQKTKANKAMSTYLKQLVQDTAATDIQMAARRALGFTAARKEAAQLKAEEEAARKARERNIGVSVSDEDNI